MKCLYQHLCSFCWRWHLPCESSEHVVASQEVLAIDAGRVMNDSWAFLSPPSPLHPLPPHFHSICVSSRMVCHIKCHHKPITPECKWLIKLSCSMICTHAGLQTTHNAVVLTMHNTMLLCSTCIPLLRTLSHGLTGCIQFKIKNPPVASEMVFYGGIFESKVLLLFIGSVAKQLLFRLEA